MEPRESVKLPDGLRQSIANYCDLKVVRKIYGNNHPHVFQRAANIITKFVRNFTGMTFVFRRVLQDVYEVPLDVGVPLLRKSWYWPRNYYFNYPSEFVGTWHSPSSGWKRNVMRRYCTEEQMSRSLSRYELFFIQKEMDEEDILALGW